MKRVVYFLILFGLLLTACMPGEFLTGARESKPTEDLSLQAATMVAQALRQTAVAQLTLTPLPVPTDLAEVSSVQKHYQSSALGFVFDYPETWYVQENELDLPITVIVTSFDPANPPHKLEWTDQTLRVQFRLLPAGTVPPALDAWAESAKQTATTNQLSIFAEEGFLIDNQPAVSLTLVSGSGGILHQVLTIQDVRYYEITIEGNLDNGKSLLRTFRAIPSGGVKPPDSDFPAAGICSDLDGDPVSIVLGVGPDGLPEAGRCVAVRPEQHIVLINQSDMPFSFKLPGLVIDLPAGQQILLEKSAGSYFAPGVHFLPMGPELWIKGQAAATVPVATTPGPLRNYDIMEVGYSLTLPPGWNVDENGLGGTNKEVIFYPGNAEAFVVYLSVSLDSRTLEEIESSYAQNLPEAVKDNVVFNGLPGIKFTNGRRIEFYIPYHDRILLITTDKPDDGTVQLILKSIRFQ